MQQLMRRLPTFRGSKTNVLADDKTKEFEQSTVADMLRR